ncbi:MAG: T9SS type A sorting domain-containing protein [candidate division Zixibacteria bacterium]|nr:T9SS type A sorting domain-containing protein [candidate division Zixibacteria bacterium]
MKSTIIILSLGALACFGTASAERWPLGPGDVPQRCGNNCYEFQNYGGGSYYHDGLDVLGEAADPCYSVDDGYVSLIRVQEPLYTGIIVNYTKGQDKGWLYWHLTYSTIPFVEGDPVKESDRLGNLANWPVADFHHVHFTRGYYPGIKKWYDAIDNPIEFVKPSTDEQPPVFEEAEPGQWFSFCENNGDVRVDPGKVKGQVDVIAHVSDKIVDTHWELVPYEIEWCVIGEGGTIPPKKFVVFTGEVPPPATVTTVVYKRSGQWMTQGDYNSREFYFIITNTDGDGIVEEGDEAYSLDSEKLPNGPYTLYVWAKDFGGNNVLKSMAFTVDNPSSEVRIKSFTARAVPGGVELAWAADERHRVKYNLYRQEAGEAPSPDAGDRGRLNARPITGKSPYAYRDASAAEGVTYKYWLEALELSGHTTLFGPVTVKAGKTLPNAFALHAAAPNPARGAVVFSFALPRPCRATLAVYDLAGRKVATVVDGQLAAAEHRYPTSLALPPGVYVYRLTAGDFAAAKRLVVVR